MNPEIKKALFTIFKHGDIYQTIEKKEGISCSTIINFLLEVVIFCVSLPLYCIPFLTEKLINLTSSSMKKIHDATEEIRKVLGVKIDITRKIPNFLNLFRKNKNIVTSSLAITYEEEDTNLQHYIENLKKIETFCITYQIDEIQLREEDVTNFIPATSLNENKICRVVRFGRLDSDFVTNSKAQFWRKCRLKQISHLIHMLELAHKPVIDITLYQDIQDVVIQKAIDQYWKGKNLERLFITVTKRLEFLLNSENTKRDREGKIYETVILKDDYVSVTAKNTFGKNISQEIMTLYHYLDVINEKNLDTYIQINDEDVLEIAQFYLALLKILKKKQKNDSKTITVFDEIYEKFCKGSSIQKSYVDHDIRVFRVYLNMIRWGLFFISILSGVNFGSVSSSPKTSSYESHLEYGGSSNSDFDPLYDGNPYFNTGKIGDVSESEKDIVIATIEPLSKTVVLPHYYAKGFGFSKFYSDWSSLEYTLFAPREMYGHHNSELQKPDFEISMNINKNCLSYYLQYVFYPVDINCELTEVVIIDENTPINQILISNSMQQRTDITEKEKNSIILMEQPVIIYRYKINSTNPDLDSNLFVQKMDKSEYSYDLENRKAILKSLKLEEDATIAEIYEAIRSKDYSLTPWKDSGNHAQYIEEHEYLEAAASLDSLNCNMAATLVVETNEELYYVTGYYTDDGQITTNDGHAWAMDKNGTIIDATPGQKMEDVIKDNVAEGIAVAQSFPPKETIVDIVKECVNWALKSNIPLYTALVIASEIICKKLGKKINFRMEVKEIGKQLGQENSAEAYAKIKETWYGGINVSKQEEIPDFIETIDREFHSFTKEELQELKRELKDSGLEDKKVLKTATNMVDSIPFIRENKEYIKEFYRKK